MPVSTEASGRRERATASSQSQISGLIPNSWESAVCRGGTRIIPGMRSRAIKWTLGAFLTGYLLLTTTTLADLYSAPLRVRYRPQKSDVIVLLSSGQIDNIWLSPDAAQRTLGALKLYEEDYAPWIISSGSQSTEGWHQAELQAAWLERFGVMKDAIIVEGRSERTYTSAVEVAAIMAQRQWKSAVVVTSQMDIPRVRLVFEKLGIQTSYLAVPEFRRPQNSHLFWKQAFDVAFHATYEYAGLAYYKWKGFI
jgi:uncharacterized SAM-binding protein YcdF (DUF218 family)